MTEQNTPNPSDTPATVADLRALTERIASLQEAQRALARALPPITFADVCKDRCNFTDSAFEADVRKFIQGWMKDIDVTMLDTSDPDKWECLTPRYTAGELDPTEDGDEQYGVIDHEIDSFVTDDDDDKPLAFDSEREAARHASDLECESEHRYGFPFAQNIGSLIENESWIDDLRACGFVVYRYEGDQIIAGIDGGGYSFTGAHFAPFYARIAARNGWLVETKDGPRRIVNK